ncbi:CND1 Gas1-like protein [Apiospora arundinis]|uniref:CND1 Gas1-like protein n=1 Tax=Apiospora arundinis TaxID=335852 RepID=A0ABR2IEU2_9PEZI
MYTGTQLLALALAAASIVSAHGNVQVVTGNMGGNGTALGIKGAAVARFGKNAATEKDTTVFPKNSANKPLTDGLGKTTANGNLKVAQLLGESMQLSGNTLPQVSADGQGTISGTWRTVTSDGTAINKAGELNVVIDPTGTGKYSQGTLLKATSTMVGNGKGNVVQRALAAMGIRRRATNVGADAAFSVKIPAGTTCSGTDAASGVSNFCLMKIANNNNAGPFGGNIAFQVAGGGAAAPAAGAGAATGGAAAGGKAANAKGAKNPNQKNARSFIA